MRRHLRAPWNGASLLVYAVLLLFTMLEQAGRTTNDTKTPLIERPGTFLREATTLWNPTSNFGELANQAYGYLFPQGPFFLAGQLLHVPPWITERLWSVLIVVVGAEGCRLLARALGLSPWAAWVAGMAFGLNPRVIAQFGVRSAEVVPTAVLPWVVLPVVLAMTGRLGPRRAALFSAVAFLFSGAVNATATVAGLPLVAILLVWGARRRLVPWSMLAWWAGLLAVTNFWWAASLLRLRTYSPPFFDFVEDTQTTTSTTGYTASLRGLSNWINYFLTGDKPSFPAGFDLAYHPALVLASGVLAAIGVLGLVTFPKPWRAPLVTGAVLGLVCLTVAHTSPWDSPLAAPLRGVLDGGLALLRNVSKADPMLRLPLCLGVGAVVGHLLARRVRRPRTVPVLIGLVTALVLGMAQPALALQTRTLGWTEVPSYWHEAADYLAKAPGEQRAWIVPGSGFGIQTWGWTADEPFQGVARSPWVSRSQIPLAPPTTIRILSRLERFLESGSGSPNLGAALGRLGLGYVLVRHDLDEQASETTTGNLVSIALARSRGVTRVKTFGNLDLGPAIELYKVTSSNVAPDLEVRPLSDAVTVSSSSSDMIDAVTQGLVDSDQPVVVQGDDGWDAPADVVGDSYRKRERNFGRVHDSEGPVLSSQEPRVGGRVVADYPANQASRPVVARYQDGGWATASTSRGWVNGLGPVLPADAPYAAFDGDQATAWRSGFYTQPLGQWVERVWPEDHAIGKVEVRTPVDGDGDARVTRWRVSAGDRTVRATVNPFTGVATADLTGVRADRLRVTVDRVGKGGGDAVPVLEVRSDATPYSRTMVLPDVDTAAHPSFVLGAQPETRACIATLLGPDCHPESKQVSEESSGIDRTFEVPESGSWDLSGTAVARSTLGTVSLLNPVGTDVVAHASSQWLADPAVSVRMAYDGASTTSWIADPRDDEPVVTLDFDRPRTLDRLTVGAPAAPAVAPTRAVIRSKEGTRVVPLGEFGQFAPLRTNHVEITFENDTRGLAPIGVSELYLQPFEISRRLDGADPTGAVCGFGPVLTVDGKRYDTRVSGFIGDVVAAGPLSFESCSGPVTLGPGTHTMSLASTEQFQPVVAVMKARGATPATGTQRTLSTARGPVTRQTMTVGPGPASLLSTTRNVNAGWQATLDGKRLPAAMSDGWAQAWRLPAGGGGEVVLTYAPQRPYLISLYGGLLAALLVLLSGLVLLVRTRLTAPRPIPDVDVPAWGRTRWLVVGVLALPVSWVLGGVPALAGVVLGAVGLAARRPVVVRWVGVALLVLGPAWFAWQLRDGPVLRSDLADLLTGTGFTLALVSLVPLARSRRTTTEP